MRAKNKDSTRKVLLKAALFPICLSLLVSSSTSWAAEDRRARVLNDRSEFANRQEWIYNDLQKGFAEAKSTGKPLLVVFRCVP